MIYYVCPITHMREGDFNNYLGRSLSSDQLSRTTTVTNKSGDSIFEKYNFGVDSIRENNFQDDDIVVFLHSDVKLIDDLLEEKLQMVFDNDEKVGMVGVYGTTLLTEHGGWWMSDRSTYGRGHILQGYENTVKHMEDRIGYFDNIVSLDGCFMAMRGSILDWYKFDESYDGYHFYDVDTSLTLQQHGWKIAVADILIQHHSEGPVGEEWNSSRQKCINKWKNLGVTFPVTSEQMKGWK